MSSSHFRQGRPGSGQGPPRRCSAAAGLYAMEGLRSDRASWKSRPPRRALRPLATLGRDRRPWRWCSWPARPPPQAIQNQREVCPYRAKPPGRLRSLLAVRWILSCSGWVRCRSRCRRCGHCWCPRIKFIDRIPSAPDSAFFRPGGRRAHVGIADPFCPHSLLPPVWRGCGREPLMPPGPPAAPQRAPISAWRGPGASLTRAEFQPLTAAGGLLG